jgi:hypothetical protein
MTEPRAIRPEDSVLAVPPSLSPVREVEYYEQQP